MPKDADELVELLDLETIDDNLFRGAQAESSLPRVFGGQVAAQALVAATRTVDPAYAVHSLHSYFLQPGDPAAPIVYDVEDLRTGRSFATRRVLGRQHGRPIYGMTASFHRQEEGFEHQDAMPGAPAADDLPVHRRGRAVEDDEWGVVDIRFVGRSGEGLPADEEHPARQRVWLRVSSRLPDDPVTHAAAFAYLSDMTIIGAALAPHGEQVMSPRMMVASLDHTVWFHRPFRADEWWLYDQLSPSASGARGLVVAKVFDAGGTLVASVAQEALMRRADPSRRRGA